MTWRELVKLLKLLDSTKASCTFERSWVAQAALAAGGQLQLLGFYSTKLKMTIEHQGFSQISQKGFDTFEKKKCWPTWTIYAALASRDTTNLVQ